MNEYKIGDCIQVIVIGSQPYGLFVYPENDEEVTGLIHISEISYDFVKDVNKVATIGDKINVKILDFNKETKHLKLSIKALTTNRRYRNTKDNLQKRLNIDEKELKDFTPLENKLSEWVNESLKREK